eukprot:CAMPEP_0197638404 /NCGR_PEP_ID=MMETSP1338-20131121/13342_1 /TAXON_ID=43686 ORGANISM="Pelagodinium beii, Strain RCC1491" /NCGR_SAMPLE_ID=MMETSP1338 /ASSEMBLY_ACC=CAM_ASM_000754 /LENGTH=542 /DNA_ID=CAMNT_0043210977 /DNA_START=147 /DNA_END=1772 /DNA_ORIENTATION=+
MALAALALIFCAFLPRVLGTGRSEALAPELEDAAAYSMSLLQVGSEKTLGTSERSSDPRDAEFFNSFALEEDTDLLEDQGKVQAKGSAWLHKSQTGGTDEASQTNYPSRNSASVERPDSQVQNLKVAANLGSTKPKLGLLDQVESTGSTLRTVSGNLTCEKPGCTANTTLVIYDSSVEYINNCTMSFGAHATDFDDNFAGERIFDILANGRTLGGDCFPLANGCVSQLSRDVIYPCVKDYPVDSIISSSGKVAIMAAIPKVVDECPYNGNLLHAVATLSCIVSPITTTTTTTTTPPPPEYPSYNSYVDSWEDKVRKGLEDALQSKHGSDETVTARQPKQPTRTFLEHRVQTLYESGHMRCTERGCSASLVMDLNQTLVSLDKCLVQMTVNQTDFDNNDGSFERLSVNVSGVPALVDAAPGMNPCRDFYAGKAPTQEQMSYHALKDLDITDLIRQGPVVFTARISRQVDECPSNGYLFDSKLEVQCNVTSIGAYLQSGATSVADVLKLNQALLEGSDAEANGALKDFFSHTAERTAEIADSLS